MNNAIRLSSRRRLLILKCIRYAMDSASLWTFEPGPPIFELYLIGRAMMVKAKGHPLRWQGHLDEDDMKKELDEWIESLFFALESRARMPSASDNPQTSSL